MKFGENILFYFRLWGVLGGIKFLFDSFFNGVENIYFIDLDNIISDNKKTEAADLDFFLVENKHGYNKIYEDYIKIKGCGLAEQDMGRIVEGKEYMAVVCRENAFAGWGWVIKGPLKYGDISLSKQECLICKCRTLREHRKKGIYSFLLNNLKFELKKKNYRKIFISSKIFNKASIGGIQKAGFEFVEKYDAGSFPTRLWKRILKKSAKKIN